jgi:hypothetical protein
VEHVDQLADRAAPRTEPAPFFIVGSERSGTTMLRLMLNRHSRLCVPPESHFITRLYDRFDTPPPAATFLQALADDDRFREWNLPISAVAVPGDAAPSWSELFGAVFRAYAATQGKVRWGDKTPIYVARVDALRAIFGPGVKVIQIVRDGRDVVASMRGMKWNRGSVWDNAKTWSADVQKARADGRAAGPDAYHEVVYERIIADPEGELRGVCRHLGEPYEPGMLEFFEDAATAIPAHRQTWHANATRPANDSAIGRWRHDLSAAEVAVVEWAAGSSLDALGYPRSGVSRLRALPLLARLAFATRTRSS